MVKLSMVEQNALCWTASMRIVASVMWLDEIPILDIKYYNRHKRQCRQDMMLNYKII